MVKVVENYITEIMMKEDFEDVKDCDELYIETEDGTYHIPSKEKIQADYDGITFIDTWKGIRYYEYEDVCIYRVKKSCFQNRINEREPDILFIIFGIMVGFFLCMIMGA